MEPPKAGNPPAAPAAPAAAAAPAGAAVAGPNLGPIILLGGAAAAAGVAAIALGGLGQNCGSAPTSGGYTPAWWADYSEWCRCNNGTPDINSNSCIQ